MGYGNYSHAAHVALTVDRATNKAGQEIFQQSRCHALMDPRGLKVRESRDSPDHPNALPVVFALDVTGSMGAIPRLLATRELPTFMKLLTECGVADPQLMFMAVGDATSDHAALQVGQFESTAELMDQWLTWTYLEGGGGGSGEESYELVFYTLAAHTDLDSWSRRKKQGYLFMTGDERPYPAVSRHQVEALFGEKLDEDIPIADVIGAASESYHPFFLIPDLARRVRCERVWRDLLGDHVICMESPNDTCAVAAVLVGITERLLKDGDDVSRALHQHGMGREQIGSVMRAVKPYMELADPQSANRIHQAARGAPSPRPSWWQRVFGRNGD